MNSLNRGTADVELTERRCRACGRPYRVLRTDINQYCTRLCQKSGHVWGGHHIERLVRVSVQWTLSPVKWSLRRMFRAVGGIWQE